MFLKPLHVFTTDEIEIFMDNFILEFLRLPLPCGPYELWLWGDA